jgi:hypothetical protein
MTEGFRLDKATPGIMTSSALGLIASPTGKAAKRTGGFKKRIQLVAHTQQRR